VREKKNRERMGYAKRYTCPDRFFSSGKGNTTLDLDLLKYDFCFRFFRFH